mmetsp:Transcript_3264/g.13416  ORF Transcript_3264/g.13416 Transcript_3264/m.13416 type:complete len:509 (+) Transcript_3264:1033-2559(+)
MSERASAKTGIIAPPKAPATRATTNRHISGRWYDRMRPMDTTGREAVSRESSRPLRDRAGGRCSTPPLAAVGARSQMTVLLSRPSLTIFSVSGRTCGLAPLASLLVMDANAALRPTGAAPAELSPLPTELLPPPPIMASALRTSSSVVWSHHAMNQRFSDSAISRKADWRSTMRGSDRDSFSVEPVSPLSAASIAASASAADCAGPVAPSSRAKKSRSTGARPSLARKASTRDRMMSTSAAPTGAGVASPPVAPPSDPTEWLRVGRMRGDPTMDEPSPDLAAAAAADAAASSASTASAMAAASADCAGSPPASPCPAARAWYTPLRASSSAWVPCSTSVPRSITTMVVALVMVESRWAIRTDVSSDPEGPLSSLSIAADTCFSDSESSAEVASSPMKMAGLRMSARAMATRCFCPPESWPPRSPTRVRYALGRDLAKPSTEAALAASMTRLWRAGGRMGRSSTERPWDTSMPKTRPLPVAMALRVASSALARSLALTLDSLTSPKFDV